MVSKVDEKELLEYAVAFSKKHFNVDFNISLRISNRMTAKLGAFVIKTRHNRVINEEIVMSKTFIDNNPRHVILDVLHHECVHFCLYRLNKPYRDQDDYFKNTLKKLNISLTRTYRYKGILHHYQCMHCNYKFTKRMKGYEKRYVCAGCHSRFAYLGQSNESRYIDF